MSILSQLFAGKITFGQAVTEGEQWFEALLAKAPPAVQADVSAGLSDFKQAASNAVALADTALGPIMSVGTLAVEGAATAALTAAFGPAAGVTLSPGVDAGIQAVGNGFHAEVDAVLSRFRAQIVSTPAPVQQTPAQQSGGQVEPAT